MADFEETTGRRGAGDDEIVIDLGEIVGVLLHYIVVLIVVTVAFAVAGYSVSKFVLPEQFESTTKIYILNKSDSANQVNYNDVQTSTSLTKDYAQLITSRYVLEMVIEDLGMDYTYEQFKDKISVSNPTDTRIVSITVTDTDPATAQLIANTVREAAAEHITKVMDIDAVNIVEEANLPTQKSSPSVTLWTGGAGAVGFLITALIIIIGYVLDDSIKTAEDVERYLGLSTLALIPLDEGINKEKVEKSLEKEDKGRRKKSKKTAASTASTNTATRNNRGTASSYSGNGAGRTGTSSAGRNGNTTSNRNYSTTVQSNAAARSHTRTADQHDITEKELEDFLNHGDFGPQEISNFSRK